MSQQIFRNTICSIIDNLYQQREICLNTENIDLQRIISRIEQERELQLDGDLYNKYQLALILEQIIQQYEEAINLDDEQLQQWWQTKNQIKQDPQYNLLESNQFSEIFDMMDEEEDDKDNSQVQLFTENVKIKCQTQYHPQQEIVNTDIYRVSIRQNHLFQNIFGFPIIIIHPNIQDRLCIIFTQNTETLESLWCRVFQLKILEDFFIFYFHILEQKNKKTQRNTPLIACKIGQPNQEIYLITSQQAYVPMIEYKLQRDSKRVEKNFIYYYNIQVENQEILLCGDGICFYEEKKGYLIIQEIVAGDKIFHKVFKRYCLVKSIHLMKPGKPIQAKLLESCLHLNELQNINEYLFKQVDLQFLDEKKTLFPVIFKVGGKEEFQLKINFPPSCPMYLLSQYYIYDQRLFNHNPLMKYQFQENTKAIPLNNREKIQNYPKIEFDLQQMEFQSKSFLIFICSKSKLLIQRELPCQIVENKYEINTEGVFKEFNLKYGFGKLSVFGNGIRFNNNRIKTSTFDLYLVYHLDTCYPSINVTFKLNENTISVALCQDTKVYELSQIVEQLLNSKLETQKYIVFIKDKLILNLEKQDKILKYSLNNTLDIYILKTSAYQAFQFQLLIQNDFNQNLQQLFDSLKFIKKPIKQMYKRYQKDKTKQKYTLLSELEAFCIYLYTTSYLYQPVNQQIRDTQLQRQQQWKIYLSIIVQALKKLPSKKITLFRGIKCSVDYSKFKIGNYVYFQNFLSTSIEQDIALTFSGDNGLGTLFEIDSLNGKSISKFSQFPNENEFLIPPYSLFVVQNLTKSPNHTRIKLKEIGCPKSLKLVLWIDTRQLSEELQFKLQSFGYEIIYVNANIADLQENFNLWGSFYNILSNKEMKIICNFMVDINLELLKCIFNTNHYNKELYLYMKQPQFNFIKQFQYLGVYKIIDDVQKIEQESNLLINCHTNHIINNFLNMLQLEPGMIDGRFNQQWLPGQKNRLGICTNLENWIGIGIRQYKLIDQSYLTFYTGVQIQDIKQILQNVNSGLNVKLNKFYQFQIEIINAEGIYLLTDANCAGQMQAPFKIGNQNFTFVLQVKVQSNNLVNINLQQNERENFNQNCFIYSIKKKEDVIIQRLLIQYN